MSYGFERYNKLKRRCLSRFYGPHRAAESAEEGYAYWHCDVCACEVREPFVVGRDVGREVLLCDYCAEAIANRWVERRSGEFITWSDCNGNADEVRENKRKPIGASKRKFIYERDGYRCRYCGGYEDLCIDHVKPVSQGGKNKKSNLVTACRACNSKKAANTPSDAGMKLTDVLVEVQE